MENKNQGSEKLSEAVWTKILKDEITPTDKFIALLAIIIIIARLGGCEYP